MHVIQQTFTLLIQVMSLMKWMYQLILSTMDNMFRVRGDLANGDGDVLPDPIGAGANVHVGADVTIPDCDPVFGLWSYQHSTPYRYNHPDESFSSPSIPVRNKKYFFETERKEIAEEDEERDSSMTNGCNDSGSVTPTMTSRVAATMMDDSASATPPARTKFFFMDSNNNVDSKSKRDSLVKRARFIVNDAASTFLPSAVSTPAVTAPTQASVDKYCRKPLWEYGPRVEIPKHKTCRKPLWEY